MAEAPHGDWLLPPAPQAERAILLVRRLADRQFGRVARRQLHWLGISNGQIGRWVKSGYTPRVLPGVYAVGHAAPSVAGDLAAALLYAGPGAMLSHASAAWWHGLLKARPITIDLTTPRRCQALPPQMEIRIHDRRDRNRMWRNGLPVTSVPDTLLDCSSAGAAVNDLRRLLAQADYRGLLDPQVVQAACRPGRSGSATLRAALDRHLPLLAQTRSPLEDVFVFLCEAADVPLPEVNVPVAGVTVDALWRERRLVVELDGRDNHRTPAQIERDRHNELRLRRLDFLVIRYTWWQVTQEYALVAPDLRAAYDRHVNYTRDV